MAGMQGHSAIINQFSSVNRVQAAIDGYETGPRLIILRIFHKIVILDGVYDIIKRANPSSSKKILGFKRKAPWGEQPESSWQTTYLLP